MKETIYFVRVSSIDIMTEEYSPDGEEDLQPFVSLSEAITHYTKMCLQQLEKTMFARAKSTGALITLSKDIDDYNSTEIFQIEIRRPFDNEDNE